MRPWRSHLTSLSLFLQLHNGFVSHPVVCPILIKVAQALKSQGAAPTECDENPEPSFPAASFLGLLVSLAHTPSPWKQYLGCRGFRRIRGGTHRCRWRDGRARCCARRGGTAGRSCGHRTQGRRLGVKGRWWSAAQGAPASLATCPVPQSDEERLLRSVGRVASAPHLGGPVPSYREELWSGPVSTGEPG